MKLRTVVRRFLLPSFLVRLLYYWRYRTLVGPRAEVEYAPGARWGAGCVISSFTKIKVNGPLDVGRRVHIATGCFIAVDEGGLTIGDNVLIGPNVAITTTNYVYDQLGIPLHEQGYTSKGVRIGKNVWLGANSCVMDGAVIGDDVIVSAGSVVSGPIPANAIVQGNPARVIFTRR
ncbi:MAG: acyltransferase [Gemmatimonadaceae bacterium]